MFVPRVGARDALHEIHNLQTQAVVHQVLWCMFRSQRPDLFPHCSLRLFCSIRSDQASTASPVQPKIFLKFKPLREITLGILLRCKKRESEYFTFDILACLIQLAQRGKVCSLA